MKLNPFTLSFRDEFQELEDSFRDQFCQDSITQIRIVLITATIMYGIFGFLDTRVFKEYSVILSSIRYAVVCPALLGVFFLTFNERFCRIMQPVNSLLLILSASGVFVMAYRAPQDYIFSYYAGIVLVLMFGYTLSKLRFIYATCAGWLILALYELTTLTLGQESLVVFLTNNFFFISVNLLGMLSCYSIEYSARKEFYSTWLLRQEESRVRDINARLESTVEKRTAELRNALNKQEEMQDKLVESEKIEALGNLVAGIAHEINTPIGVGITATSFLEYKLKAFNEREDTHLDPDEELEKLSVVMHEGISLTLRNLLKAAELIRMFRLVAVNHTGERKITIGLKYYLEEIVKGVDKGDDSAEYIINIQCSEELEIKNCPDHFAIVVSNIVKNAFQHGFKGLESGLFTLEVAAKGDTVSMDFIDNGNGMSDESVLNIFNPFYTTARQEAHTGLGMHITHSIVNRVFSGRISCKSMPGKGTAINVNFPRFSSDTESRSAKQSMLSH